MGGITLIGGYLFSKMFPKATQVSLLGAQCGTLYLAYKSLFNPKPEETTWWQEIKNDFSRSYTWVNSWLDRPSEQPAELPKGEITIKIKQ